MATDEITLREYIESRLDSLHNMMRDNFKSLEQRLDGMNRFREQLNRQAETFVTREAKDKCREGMYIELNKLNTWKSNMEGMATQRSVNFAIFVALSGFIAGVSTLLIQLLKIGG